MAISAISMQSPYCATINNGNSQSTYLIKDDLTSIGTSYIVTINRRGNVHGVIQAVISANSSDVDVVMTAGTGITAALATGGVAITIPSYSKMWIMADHKFSINI